MADTQDEIRDAMEKQVRDLRSQIASINKSLSKNGFDIDEMRGDAENFMHGAQKNARRAAHHVQSEANVVANAAQKAPVAISTALTIATAIGFGLGYLVSRAEQDNHKRWF